MARAEYRLPATSLPLEGPCKEMCFLRHEEAVVQRGLGFAKGRQGVYIRLDQNSGACFKEKTS